MIGECAFHSKGREEALLSFILFYSRGNTGQEHQGVTQSQGLKGKAEEKTFHNIMRDYATSRDFQNTLKVGVSINDPLLRSRFLFGI